MANVRHGGKLNKLSTLSSRQVEELIKLRKQGRSVWILADLHHVAYDTMRRYLKAKMSQEDYNRACDMAYAGGVKGKARPTKCQNKDVRQEIIVAAPTIKAYYCEDCGGEWLPEQNRCPHCVFSCSSTPIYNKIAC